jgi:hypothetical protein
MYAIGEDLMRRGSTHSRSSLLGCPQPVRKPVPPRVYEPTSRGGGGGGGVVISTIRRRPAPADPHFSLKVKAGRTRHVLL